MPSQQLLHGVPLFIVKSPIACVRWGLLRLFSTLFILFPLSFQFMACHGGGSSSAGPCSQAAPLPPWPHPVTFVTRRQPQHFASLLETSSLPVLKAIKTCKKPVGVFFLSSTHIAFRPLPPPARHRELMAARSSAQVGAAGPHA